MFNEEHLLTAIERLVAKLDDYVEGTNQILHPKRIPLEIYALAGAGAQNKCVVGCVRNRRAKNMAVNSTGGWQRIFTGFDDDQPFIMNMSAQNISINFDGESSESDNNAILIPSGYMFVYPGQILPVSAWTGVAAPLVGQVRLQDGTTGALAAIATPADAFAAPGATAVEVMTFSEGWNNATWDRIRSAAAAILGAFSSVGAWLVAPPGNWSQTHAPAANVVATTTKAGVAATRHVCTSITASLVAGAIAPAVAIVTAVLRDGASGVGTILWSEQIVTQAVAGDKDNIVISGLNIVGTAAAAMTLEFTAAGGANTTEVVSMTGYDAT